MPLTIESVKRKFVFNKVTLPDPGPEFTPEEVMKYYIHQYPDLTNASVSGPKMKDDEAVYEFATTLGTKG